MDTDVVNGRTYYYAIVAYDLGLSPNGDITSGKPPSENNAIIELNENEYVISTGRNVQVVIPKAPSAGYIMDSLKIDDSKKYFGTGSYEVEIVADNQIIPNTDYYVVFDMDTQSVALTDNDRIVPYAIYTSGFSIYTDFNSDPVYSEKGEIQDIGIPNFILDNFISTK